MTRHEIGRTGFLGEELAGAELGDERLTRRLSAIVDSLAAAPSSSFPGAAGNDAALEATYRFFNNENVTPERILAPHIRCTVERARAQGSVVIAHDTTQFNFGAFEREGLGRVGRGSSFGFFGHFALAVAADGTRMPLGVVGLHTMVRGEKKKPRRKHGKNQLHPENEARRWLTLVEETQAKLAGKAAALHVMDREGDNYALFSRMTELNARFVVRMKQDRVLAKRPPNQVTEREGHRTVTESLSGAKVLAQREVPLSTRRRQEMPSNRKRHPPRVARLANLQISAGRVTIPRPITSKHSPHESLALNLIHVFEVEAPTDTEPVEWWLWTTEPVDTEEQVLAAVDAYRTRWIIEEYFKSLKTGCAYEKRQLESAAALLNALAVLASVAWRLLVLRTLSRDRADAPASAVLTPSQVTCLRGAYRRRRKRDLPTSLNVREAMLALAALGGHIAANGEPGWQVLGRGFDKLLSIEEGYWLAVEGHVEM